MFLACVILSKRVISLVNIVHVSFTEIKKFNEDIFAVAPDSQSHSS
jgi:hypothetical protein